MDIKICFERRFGFVIRDYRATPPDIDYLVAHGVVMALNIFRQDAYRNADIIDLLVQEEDESPYVFRARLKKCWEYHRKNSRQISPFLKLVKLNLEEEAQ